MTQSDIRQQVLDLPEDERLEIADAIWESLEDPDSLPLPAWQRELLDERLASAKHDEGKDWDEVKREIWPQPPRRRGAVSVVTNPLANLACT